MASSRNPSFEEAQISSEVTADNALEFYEQHGIFYQENPEIGRLASEMRGSKQRDNLFNAIKPLILKDPRLTQIAEPFLNSHPKFDYVFGDHGKFFALTRADHQDSRMCLYVWGNDTAFEFCCSHIGELQGVPASNKLFEIPWPFLHGIRKLVDYQVVMKEGGIAIVHPRLSVSVKKGLPICYACDRTKDQA